ncbi:NAD(P)/FAD-dependent oxidoreductase [Paenibacillus hunanensis]|uniref:dihydrolipoyl dehydrogenase family protein n=1 Tax=Paenibacillus hunanensis TaxID=539262 RepID=UPI0020265A43|nr:NAD(P)/FAD-dependent oxidoreductase [Paenibacillus hunanensis]
MTSTYDLIVIGTGSAGAAAAQLCRQEGWEVAIIDEREYGGTCALRGCDPKKVLVGAADLVERTARMRGKGMDVTAMIDWSDLMAFKRTFTEPMPEAHEQKLQEAGIHTLHGQAHFTGKQTIELNGQQLTGRYILIATGAEPAPLSIPGEEHMTNSDGFLGLEHLPEQIVFVGGGYISFEFAHIAARAGAKVHILHSSDRPLKGFDPEQVDALVEQSRQAGIQIHLNVELESIELLHPDSETGGAIVTASSLAPIAQQNQPLYRIHARYKQADNEHADASAQSPSSASVTSESITNESSELLHIECGLIVHGAGRRPNIHRLELEQGNVESQKKGITVNEYLQSVSNPQVYAAGDCAASPGLPLTPIAGLEGKVAANNMLHGPSQKAEYTEIPSVAFTMPRLATVGLSEQDARKRGDEVSIKTYDMSSWYTYKRTGGEKALAKIILDKQKRTVLGAHLLSGEADELINHFAVAIRLGLTVDQLKSVIYAYPTAASDISYMLNLDDEE